jgi:hypothetical protein
MENLDSSRFIMREKDCMVKLDLKDAYLTITVGRVSHQENKKATKTRNAYDYLSL